MAAQRPGGIIGFVRLMKHQHPGGEEDGEVHADGPGTDQRSGRQQERQLRWGQEAPSAQAPQQAWQQHLRQRSVRGEAAPSGAALVRGFLSHLPPRVGVWKTLYVRCGRVGIPRSTSSRFYVQLAQKNRLDLEDLRDRMQGLGLKCGCLHVPSVAADPEYWRFYVAAASHRQFYERVGSWHPRKRALLDSRFNRSGLQ